MSINIRKGIYETNSSSVHVLCINKNNDISIPDSFTFNRGGEFGWNTDTYTDMISKGQYFYLILKSYAENKRDEEYALTEEGKQYQKDTGKWYFWDVKTPLYKELGEKYLNEYKTRVENILNEYKCYSVNWEPEPEFNSIYDMSEGYIDHISEAFEFFTDMMDNPELLINFLFGNSSINTGNDNDDYSYDRTYANYNDNHDYEYVKGN